MFTNRSRTESIKSSYPNTALQIPALGLQQSYPIWEQKKTDENDGIADERFECIFVHGIIKAYCFWSLSNDFLWTAFRVFVKL